MTSAARGCSRWRSAARALAGTLALLAAAALPAAATAPPVAASSSVPVAAPVGEGSPGASGAPPAAGEAVEPAAFTRLSNLRTLTLWAFPVSEALVRDAPFARARAIGRLGFLTSDAQAALYVELASQRLPSGQSWVQIELPGRPNGKRGWVPADALGVAHAVRDYLLIDRRALRARLYRGGRVVFSAPVGVGKASTITPAGSFYVMEKLTTLGAPIYGPYAVGTSAYAPTLSEWPGGGIVGIHGTDEPQLIPGRPSHGCVRMRNGDITRLWHMISLGTPIRIR